LLYQVGDLFELNVKLRCQKVKLQRRLAECKILLLYGTVSSNRTDRYLASFRLLLHIVRRYKAAAVEESDRQTDRHTDRQTLLFSFCVCVFLPKELAVTRYFVVKSFSARSFVPFWLR